MPYPKVELHVHLEGTVRARTLRQIAKRNDYPLPDDLERRYRFRGFRDFIEVFELRMGALQTHDDFRRVVVEYAAIAAFSVRYRERGVVGLGLVGTADGRADEPFARAFAIAREGGLGAVPHAGEVAGPESVRGALEILHADRIRHGIRAAEDPGLVRELAARGTVLDVCPLSNLRLRVVASLADHPLPRLVAAGVRCSISTDDPAMFDNDLTREYEAATSFGLDPRSFYEAGVAGALCDEDTRTRLRQIAGSHNWRS